MRQISKAQMDAIFDSLPEWIKIAVRQSPLMYSIVKRCLHGGKDREFIIEAVAQGFHGAFEDLMRNYVRLYSALPPQIVIKL